MEKNMIQFNIVQFARSMVCRRSNLPPMVFYHWRWQSMVLFEEYRQRAPLNPFTGHSYTICITFHLQNI